LDTPDEGEIFFRGENLKSFSNKQLAAFRNKNIGFIFQFHHLLPEFTALENILMPGLLANQKKAELEPRALLLLEKLGLKDRAQHKPAELSGGEAQRVAVARALMNQPQLICADEPSGNLDSEKARELHQLFFNLRKEFNITFLIVTHNEELANMSDRKLLMKDGQILSDATNNTL
jgi:lipoprotein-releasing system ATP-binding protein